MLRGGLQADLNGEPVERCLAGEAEGVAMPRGILSGKRQTSQNNALPKNHILELFPSLTNGLGSEAALHRGRPGILFA